MPAGSGGADYIRPAKPAGPTEPREITVPLKDKPSVSMILGQATGLRYRDPEALALRVGTAILGHGFTGRLMGTVRDKEGLTYNIGAAVTEDSIADGAWDISASFAPSLLEQGRRIDAPGTRCNGGRTGITDAELSARKQGIVGGYLVGLSTTGGIANAILTAVQRGYDVSWLDRYPEAIKALDPRSGQHRHPRSPRSEEHGAGRGRKHPRRRPLSRRNAARAQAALRVRRELPQHIVQDAAVLVVLEFLRRIDAQAHLELGRLAVVGPGEHFDGLRRATLQADDVEGLPPLKPETLGVLARP